MKRAIWVIVIIAVIVVAGFAFVNYRQGQASALPTYQTLEIVNGELVATVGATGTVRANQNTTVNWQTSGRISKINVKEGDKVVVNQVLAELDSLSLSQSMISARADLVTAQRNLENLQDSKTAKAQAQQTLADAQKALQDAKDERYRKNLGRATQASVDQVQADLVIANDKLKNAKENYDKFANKAEDDVQRANAFSSLAQAQQKVDQLNANLNWLLSFPEKNEVSIADAAIAVAQAKLDDAQREWDRLKDGPDPKDLAAAQAKIDAIQSTLALSSLKAPINGTITDIKSMVGDQVNSGSVTFRIDDFSHLLVDVNITEVDINRVKPGQGAKLTFDAIPDKEYNGTVVDISSFGTTQSGVVNFTVTVELTGADSQVRPGMTAAVTVTVQKLDDVLLVPNRAVRLRDGARVVYVLNGSTVSMVDITLGATSDTNTQVVGGGLKAGDLVILNPPTTLTPPTGGGGMGAMFGGAR
jgi:HlyD family secretion protein